MAELALRSPLTPCRIRFGIRRVNLHNRAFAMVTDHTTQSNINEIATKSAHYDLFVDFASKVINGTAKVKLEAQANNVQIAAFDTRNLACIHAAINNRSVEHSLEGVHEVLGQRLCIPLLRALDVGEEVDIVIKFQTTPESSALQWLDPSQTAGGQLPYLFSQCQAIHARSFVPCQDSPSIKLTYTATVNVPKTMRALMSATLDSIEGKPDESWPEERTIFSFRQDIPMPSYLLAIACGDLTYRQIGPRSKIVLWTRSKSSGDNLAR